MRKKVSKVEVWYDKYTRLWVVQKLDAEGNQIGIADYADRATAETLKKQYEEELDKQRMLLEQCDVRCIRCGTVWASSLEVEHINCLNCGQQLYPKKHVAVESENGVN